MGFVKKRPSRMQGLCFSKVRQDGQQYLVGFRQSQSFFSGAALNAHKGRVNVAPIIDPPADTYSTDDSCGKVDNQGKCTRQAELVVESIVSSVFKPWALKTSMFRVNCQSYKNAGMAVKVNHFHLLLLGQFSQSDSHQYRSSPPPTHVQDLSWCG